MGKYLILGSGISGCTAAEALAKQGHAVALLEAGNRLGGAIWDYACKATTECSRCGVCVAHTQVYQAVKHAQVTTFAAASIQSVTNDGKQLTVSVRRKNPSIAYPRCRACDQCVRVCPEQCIMKLQRGELVQYLIDYAKCRLHRGQTCTACADACSAQAIFAETATTDMTLTVDAALIATGHAPYDATQKVRLGYGRLENVLTGLEAEKILNRQTYLRHPADNIAFIQCVGSRDPHIGRNYCSSVCCAYALRLARIMKHRSAATQVTIYYIDLQNFDKTFTLFRKSVEDSGVRFVRGIPLAVEQAQSGKLQLRVENADGGETIAAHDLVVLSVGLGPTPQAENVAALFGLQRDEFGFLASASPNVFVSGTCQEPLSIPDSMAAARAIAFEMGTPENYKDCI